MSLPLIVGGKYNWKGQLERLVYLGKQGLWYQFAKVEEPWKVWCEILANDLHNLEETVQIANPNTTSTTGLAKSFTLKDVEEAARLIQSLPVNIEWMLVSPEGKVWKGKPMDLLPVLAQHHPLLQIPNFTDNL
jgi:hypothetical protein